MTRTKRSSSPALRVHGMQQGILKLDIGALHAMQEHVQLADGPGRRIVHLAAQAHIGRITTDCSMNSRLMMSILLEPQVGS